MKTNNIISDNHSNLFEVRTANQVLIDAAALPDPVELYPTLIIEGEITIVFADTGIGKTALAVQISIDIAKNFDKNILYVDLELSDKQFEKRYRDDDGIHFKFPDNFFRASYGSLQYIHSGLDYEKFFIDSLMESIRSIDAAVVVIDNMTRVVAGDTDSAKNTIPIMNSLLKLKKDQGLTFIILEHNKKVDYWRPLSLNDLQGSKMKSNFADSVFTIGRVPNDKNLRYIKQLKVRSTELEYDSENVLICELTKNEDFLGFEIIENGNEFDLLKMGSCEGKINKIEAAHQLKKDGKSNVAIAEELGVTEGAVRKWLKK